MEKNRSLTIKLFPEISNFTRENPPIASFRIRVISSVGDRKCLLHPGKVKNISSPRQRMVLCIILMISILFHVQMLVINW